ncbi:MAG: hypothetical protein AAGC77_03670 [Pseudomonadota bacterium]
MLSTARVEIPAPIAARLEATAALSDNVNDYARDDLIGFKRPIAAAFALVAPLAIAFVYRGLGAMPTLEVAGLLAGMLLGGLLFVGKVEWPNIVASFQEHAMAKRRAVADLRCGFGESCFLNNMRAPRFFEYDQGVIVLADAGDFKTLFFDIHAHEDDPRWALYTSGALERRVWRWLRLPVSREVVKFATEGTKLSQDGPALGIESIDVYEAINVALGEPLDGAIIHRPFGELADSVQRLL